MRGIRPLILPKGNAPFVQNLLDCRLCAGTIRQIHIVLTLLQLVQLIIADAGQVRCRVSVLRVPLLHKTTGHLTIEGAAIAGSYHDKAPQLHNAGELAFRCGIIPGLEGQPHGDFLVGFFPAQSFDIVFDVVLRSIITDNGNAVLQLCNIDHVAASYGIIREAPG